MKAVVMEIKDGHAAVLTDDGRFIKITDNGYEPGMKLSLRENIREIAPDQPRNSLERKQNGILRHIRTFSAAAAAAIALVFGVNLYYTPYAVISMDVNPSIEITVNRFDKVLSVEAVNEDGAELAGKLLTSGVKNKSYDTAVDMALAYVSEGKYEADDGKAYVVLSTTAGDADYSETVREKLADRAASYEKISAEVVIATEEEASEAKKLGTTPGKIHLINKLEDKEPEIEKKEWVARPVKDIVSEINKEKPENDIKEKPDTLDSNVKNTEENEKQSPEQSRKQPSEHSPEQAQEPVPEQPPEYSPEQTQEYSPEQAQEQPREQSSEPAPEQPPEQPGNGTTGEKTAETEEEEPEKKEKPDHKGNQEEKDAQGETEDHSNTWPGDRGGEINNTEASGEQVQEQSEKGSPGNEGNAGESLEAGSGAGAEAEKEPPKETGDGPADAPDTVRR